ncbi:hypothetical protein [Chamaesiphon sp.]|uniref:hypothetical protein n=1 Tax=Chamaesiphon sp. TaxID=2814140 RepID=UPI0035944890
MIIEYPDSEFVRLSLALSSKTDPEILAYLAASEKQSDKICVAIARNINTPIDSLKKLIGWKAEEDDGDYPHIAVTKEVLNSPRISASFLEEIVDKYIDCGWSDLIREIAKLPILSSKIINKLAEKSDAHSGIIQHNITQKSPEILAKIAYHCNSKNIALELLKNPLAGTTTVEYLAIYPDFQVRNAVKIHPNVSQKALDLVLFLRGKPGTPVDLLNEICEKPINDKRIYIWRLLTKYPYTPEAILDNLAQYKYYDDWVCKEIEGIDDPLIFRNLIYHPNTSSQLLRKMADIVAQSKDSYDKKIINERITGQYIFDKEVVKIESEITGHRYNQNLDEDERDVIPF